ncbi:Replication termination factor 2 [Aphelenchoides bicaudatus]|nr:Replication termination factor 2 [Aphelenchoides bicaudatus]
MGADGGTIPKRCELVRKKKKVEKIDKNVTNAAKWKTCQASGDPLQKPVVACKLGRLYNKEVILEGLLNKTLGDNDVTKHIKSRADFKELNLTENKEYRGDGPEKGNTYIDHNNTKWICPVTSLPMNGGTNFFVNFKCGCVISEKAINELKSEQCLSCSEKLDRERLIQLYPENETLKRYAERLETEHAAKKAKKASKKSEPYQLVKP